MTQSPARHRALMRAYSDEHTLYPERVPMFGVRPSLLRALLADGLVCPEEAGAFECEHRLTRRGRHALGLKGAVMRAPARERTAVLRAIRHFIADSAALPQSLLVPASLSAPLMHNDAVAHDFTDAMLLVDLRAARLGTPDALRWGCVARLVSELGHPCTVEVDRGARIAAFWPDGPD